MHTFMRKAPISLRDADAAQLSERASSDKVPDASQKPRKRSERIPVFFGWTA
jgi:hypothetical protein